MLQAGVILSDYATLMAEILKDNARPRPKAGAVNGAIHMPWLSSGRSRKPTANRRPLVGLWSDPVAVIDLYRARSMCRWCNEPMTTVGARTDADQHVWLVRWPYLTRKGFSMGYLVEGRWITTDQRPTGQFIRSDSQFRNWVTADGSPGPSGTGGFKAEAGRYHLYVSLACPWASRTLIFRSLKGLEHMVGLSVTHWLMADQGWSFAPGEGVLADSVNEVEFLYQVYTRANRAYSGRVTVPVLWDKQRHTIVSNESAEIIRMFNSAFDGVRARSGDYYPAPLRAEIDRINARIYDAVNNGVYKAGFAATQEAYEAAVVPLFQTLDWLEEHLRSRRFLVGEQPTEADWRLFTTLVRFDAVYHGHFKCNIRRLIDFPNLWSYTRELYQWSRIASTVNFVHIKRHYYMSHRHINPTGVVPVGPSVNFDTPPSRIFGAYPPASA
jgi:putative glutathione S-transferase